MTVSVLGGLAWLTMVTTIWSQAPRAMNPRNQRQYYATYNSPTVSPYVNLGTGPNGLSNYQTLVRPMIEDRAAIEQQSTALEQLTQSNQRFTRNVNRPMNQRDRRNLQASAPQEQPSVRFMDYSRYFGTTW